MWEYGSKYEHSPHDSDIFHKDILLLFYCFGYNFKPVSCICIKPFWTSGLGYILF